MSRRRQAALLAGVMEVTALEDAYAEFHREDGSPSTGQRQLLEEVEREYVKREDIDIVVEEGVDVQTPTDIEAAAHADAAVFGQG